MNMLISQQKGTNANILNYSLINEEAWAYLQNIFESSLKL